MKTKIFICSNSGMYNVSSSDISVLKNYVYYSKDEKYADGTELLIDSFYNRFRYDKKLKPTITPADYEEIKEKINNSINEEYDSFLFILPSLTFGDYSETISKIKEEYKNYKIYIFDSNSIAYPIYYMALEASKALRDNMSIDNVLKYLDEISKNTNMYFVTIANDTIALPKKLNFDDDVYEETKDSKFLIFEDGQLEQVKFEKDSAPLKKMLLKFISDVENKNAMPFILYSNKYSSYNKFVENKLLAIYPKLKTIRSYYAPASLGINIGEDFIGIGYIKK